MISLYDAFNFCGLLSLQRWNVISFFHQKQLIDWKATWDLLNFHQNLSRSSTSFKRNRQITFASKLLMDELPLLSVLQTVRRPDIYKDDWNCILCHEDKETWAHLWQCSVLKPRLIELMDATKNAFEKWITDPDENSNCACLPDDWNDLDCWKYPSSDTSLLSFDFLLKGFVPVQLVKAVSSSLSAADARTAISELLTTSKDLFFEHVWMFRCEHFSLFEKSEGISQDMKIHSSSLIIPRVSSRFDSSYS